MPRPPPRIAKVVVEHRRPPNEKLRPKHRQFIAALPCAVCGKAPPSECAHIRITEAAHPGSGGGTSFKPADRFVLSLCAAHHAEQHRVGELTFYAERGIDALQIALRLWTITGDIEAGNRVIFRTLQQIALKRGS